MAEVNDEFDALYAQFEAQQKAQQNGQKKPPSRLAHALAYARHGMKVFPLEDRGKRPRFKDWQRLATDDENQIREWWGMYPNANIGVTCTEESGITVLDVDGDIGRQTLSELELENGELPETPLAVTGGGGAHYYFRHVSGLRNAVRFKPGLDTRSDGGFVAGVGSETQQPYAWEAIATLGEVELAEMPQWLVNLISRPAAATTSTVDRQSEYAAAVEKLKKPVPEGQRDKTYFDFARLAASNRVDQVTAETLLGLNAQLSKFPTDTALEKVQRAYAERPVLVNNNTSIAAFDFERKSIEVLKWDEMESRRATHQREFVVEGMMARREISSWSGKIEAGKTTLMRELTMAIIRGEPFLGRATSKGRVFYAMLDADGEDVTFDEFKKLGFGPADTDSCMFMFEPMLAQIENGLEQFVQIVKNFGPSMVIIDPYPRLRVIEDFHSYTNTYLMAMLTEISKMVDAHLALPGHIPRGRSDDDDVASAGFGSVSFSGGVNSRFVISNRNGIRTVRSSKGKSAGFIPLDGEYILELAVDGRVTLGAPYSWKDKGKAAADPVMAFLAYNNDRAFDTKTVAKEIHLQASIVRTALRELVNNGRCRCEGEGLKSSPYIYSSTTYTGPMTMAAVKGEG